VARRNSGGEIPIISQIANLEQSLPKNAERIFPAPCAAIRTKNPGAYRAGALGWLHIFTGAETVTTWREPETCLVAPLTLALTIAAAGKYSPSFSEPSVSASRKILTAARQPACSAALPGAARAAPRARFFGQEIDGGARAWACEPVREPNGSRARSSQTTGAESRYGVATAVCGGSTGAPAWATLQAEQQPSWAPG
jgi:hypothetical protein